MERCILHSDLNGFYASVEIAKDPSLRGKPVAVCGSESDRHGIVLAKSQEAARAGVKTGMVNWEARRLCPGLVCLPPHFDDYLHYSRVVRRIYERYTDLVEPYGMDECFLDVSGSRALFGNGPCIAENIRETVKAETGLTVSVGVSFNKPFAKLGSDLKKPDAVTNISRENFRQVVWPLPVETLLYVGPATRRKLVARGVRCVGDIVRYGEGNMSALLGKCGQQLYAFAAGLDRSRVMHTDFSAPIKSVGHGLTFTADLHDDCEVGQMLLFLAQDVEHRLRMAELHAGGVEIGVRDTDLVVRQYQRNLPAATRSAQRIAEAGLELFRMNYGWRRPVRALTVRAIRLSPAGESRQCLLGAAEARLCRDEIIGAAVEGVRSRFGKWAVAPAALLGVEKVPGATSHDVILPGQMYA